MKNSILCLLLVMSQSFALAGNKKKQTPKTDIETNIDVSFEKPKILLQKSKARQEALLEQNQQFAYEQNDDFRIKGESLVVWASLYRAVVAISTDLFASLPVAQKQDGAALLIESTVKSVLATSLLESIENFIPRKEFLNPQLEQEVRDGIFNRLKVESKEGLTSTNLSSMLTKVAPVVYFYLIEDLASQVRSGGRVNVSLDPRLNIYQSQLAKRLAKEESDFIVDRVYELQPHAWEHEKQVVKQMMAPIEIMFFQ